MNRTEEYWDVTDTAQLAASDLDESFRVLERRQRTIEQTIYRLLLRTRNSEDLIDLAYLTELLRADHDEIARLRTNVDLIRKGLQRTEL